MPATRRSARSAAAKGASGNKQSTLSFNNRVTKNSVGKPAGKDLVAAASATKDAPAVLTPPPTSQPTETVEKEEEAREEARAVVAPLEAEKKSNVEIRAEGVTDAQVKRYWRDAEASRIAKRVHQQDLSVGEKVLRYFDISSQYGVRWLGGLLLVSRFHVALANQHSFSRAQPCIGITRTKRWHRAERLGLNPPIEVLAVLLKEEEQGVSEIERSTMDRLMESTAVGN